MKSKPEHPSHNVLPYGRRFLMPFFTGLDSINQSVFCDGECQGDAVQIAGGIPVNHWGSVITNEEITLPSNGYLDIEPEALNYGTGDRRSIADCMAKYPVEIDAPIVQQIQSSSDTSINAAEQNAFGYHNEGNATQAANMTRVLIYSYNGTSSI